MFQRVLANYQSKETGRTFDEDLCWHFHHGVVISRPDIFTMARPVIAHHPLVGDVGHHFPWEQADCWHIHVYAGNILKGMELFPFPLPLISWESKRGLVFTTCTRIASLIATTRNSP